MFRGLAVVFFMCWHFVVNARDRAKYRVDDKELDKETKIVYSSKIYKIMQSFSKGVVKSSGSTVVVKGAENLPTERGVLYIANHKGMFDPMTLASVIDDPCIYIGKDDIKKIPIVSTWFEAIGSLYITREDARQSLEVIKQGTASLKNNHSVVIFPEGTRSKDGQVGEFKAGSFKLALNSGADIVPIAIKNTDEIFEKVKLGLKPQTIYVNIGKPISVKGLSRAEQKALPKQIEEHVKQLHADI